ncbi:SH3 domain-containing protein [Anaerolinea sp.]|uniref:SH3 domain-containing protein n=1 Tax=Anaerolinea sp. TaxID=1872519 RepID=UPI002ACE66A8|nr:SH3 domain-containing protein [Anaerolinea sp.]
MNREVFQRYLQRRMQQANAVTLGQKIEVIRRLRAEAQSGKVPIDENSVASVDVSHPAVQAVLRGETVSLGGQSVRGMSGGMAALPGWAKLGVMLLLVLLPPLIGVGWMALQGSRSQAQAKPVPTAVWTAEASPTAAVQKAAGGTKKTSTPEPTPTVNLQEVYGEYREQGNAAADPHRLIYLPMSNEAAPEAVAPASIEMGERHFVIQVGSVDKKSGVWEPKGGIEWLPTTLVRKVVAVPEELLAELGLEPGSPIRLRYRSGYTVTYTLTRVIPDLLTDQIEILRGTTPSLVVVAYTNNLRNPRRTVYLAEMALPVSRNPVAFYTPTPVATAQPSPTPTPVMVGIVTVERLKLRAEPSQSARVIRTLERNSQVILHAEVPEVRVEGHTWWYVSAGEDSGWVVAEYLVRK